MAFIILRITVLLLLQLEWFNLSDFQNLSFRNNKTKSFTVNNHLSDNPVISPQNIIFEVKHSKSPNVVVYQANKTLKNLLDVEKPIDVFWLMITKGKKVETLTSIEWRMAFGYKLKTVIAGKKYTITLNAIKDKTITIVQNENGKVEAYMNINGVYSRLTSVYIDFEYSFYIPDVKYVDFIGRSVNSNSVTVERVSS